MTGITGLVACYKGVCISMNIEELVEKGLPNFAVPALAERGITELQPLQVQAVNTGLMEGENLIVMAPTSSGKTLIGELAALQHIVSRRGAILLTSHKALAYEKYYTFRTSYSRHDNFMFHTGIATGDGITDETTVGSSSIDIATYEKWYYMLVNEPDRIQEKSLVIVDEIQVVGDPYRGGLLESLLTWIKIKANDTQIIGLSATVPNPDDLAKWLGAKTVVGEKRPVPLFEQIWNSQGILQVERDNDPAITIVDNQAQCTETLSAVRHIETQGELPALVFCITKQRSEELARAASQMRQPQAGRQLLVNDLDDVTESNPTIRILRRILPKGIAFHNANLGPDERRLVEGAFRDGKIDLIFATPTLMAGVNLPVRTVLFDSCVRDWPGGCGYISAMEYRNMAGRAGRQGLHEEGRSVLLARSGAESERFKNYIAQNVEVIGSHLIGRDLEKVILQAVAGGLAGSEDEIENFFGNSLHATLAGKEQLFPKQEVFECLDRLSDNRMLDRSQGTIRTTPLGKQVAAAGVSSATGKLLFESLQGISSTFEWGRAEELEKQVLFLSTACPDLAPLTDNMALLFVNARSDNIGQIRSSLSEFAGLVGVHDVEDVDRSLFSAIVAYRFINKATFGELAALGRNASAANVRRITRNCEWMLTAAALIEDARGTASNREFRKWLLQMGKRLEYGVSDKAVGLTLISRFGDVRGLGRTRLERLADAGFGNLTELLGTSISRLAEIVNSTRRAEALRAAVVAYLDDSSKKNKVMHENRASKCGGAPDLVSRFYDARGTAFNRAALALLQTVFTDAREQDLGDYSEPDLAIPLADGLLVIECKTKQSTEGTIGVNDAFAVVGKSAHLRPVGMVTLGMPRFDDEPVKRALNAGVCLITHIVFCEAVIRVWEGRLNADKLLDVLKEPGFLDKTDLDQLCQNA